MSANTVKGKNKTNSPSSAANNRDTNEEKIKDLVESTEAAQLIENIKKLSSEASDIFSKPSWLKCYTVSDTYDAFVKCNLRLPADEAGGITESYISVDLFGTPPSNLKSFNYELKYGDNGNKATLVFDDYNNVVSDILIMRLEKYRRQSTPTGNVYLDIEYGYVKPKYYLPKRIDRPFRKKIKFTNTETFRLAKFTVAYNDTKATYTFELESQNTIETSETLTLRPYDILGPYPGLRLKMYDILTDMNRIVSDGNIKVNERRKKIEEQIKKMGDKSGKKKKETIELEKELEKLDKDIKEAEAFKEKANSLDKSKISGLKDLNAFKGRINTDFKQINDSLNKIMTNKDVMDLVSGLSVYIGEETVHPWDIFKYAFRAMLEQFQYDQKAPVPFILAFLNGLKYNDIADIDPEQMTADKYLEIVDKALGTSIYGYDYSKKINSVNKYDPKFDKDNLKAVSQIKVANLKIESTTSWEKLFTEIMKNVKMNPADIADPEDRDSYYKKIENEEKKLIKENKNKPLSSEQLRKITELFPRIRFDIFVNDTYSDSEYVESTSGNDSNPVEKKGTVQKILDQLESFSIKLKDYERLNSPQKANEPELYIKKVRSMVDAVITKYEKRKIMYFVLSESDAGMPFNGGKWGNNVLQGYSYRFMQRQNDSYFRAGLTNMSSVNFPDVVSFTINEYDFNSVITSITESNDATLNCQIAGKDIKAEVVKVSDLKTMDLQTRTEKLKDTGMTEEEFQKKVKEDKKGVFRTITKKTKDTERFDYLKAYRNNDSMNLNFSSNMVLTSGDDNFADVARAKKSVEVYRGLMALRAQEVKASMQILGDPQYDWFCLNKYIFVKIYNIDGSISMFSGIYMIQGIVHNFDGGTFKTTLELLKSNLNEEQLGQMAKVFFTKDVIDSYSSEIKGKKV